MAAVPPHVVLHRGVQMVCDWIMEALPDSKCSIAEYCLTSMRELIVPGPKADPKLVDLIKKEFLEWLLSHNDPTVSFSYDGVERKAVIEFIMVLRNAVEDEAGNAHVCVKVVTNLQMVAASAIPVQSPSC